MAIERVDRISYKADRIYPGVISAGVPLLHNIVQVAAGEVDGNARLSIEKSKSGIIVAREDEQPLQVAFNKVTELDTFPFTRVTPLYAFEEPVRNIRFFNKELEGGGWGAFVEADNLVVASDEAIYEFTDALGEFVPLKQMATYKSLRIKRAVKRLFSGSGLPEY
jgi:hypothetical protein